MKKFFFLFTLLVCIVSMTVSGQINAIHLTFTAVNNTSWVLMDSIRIINRSNGTDTVLYQPDTVLSIFYVGIPKLPPVNSAFRVGQNYPNPVADYTTVTIFVPAKDKVTITVTDILGRVVLHSDQVLDRGKHFFRFSPGNGNLYFLTAKWQDQSSSIKILHSGNNTNGVPALDYSGSDDYSIPQKSTSGVRKLSFTPGDELLFVGYKENLQSGMLDFPDESTVYTFQFATNIPCPGTPTVDYEGQIYNTIQILSQCWLKKDLNVGQMIQDYEEMTDNGIIEKYCYNNSPDSCAKYGGLYQWNETMQYTMQEATQGICPPGWHIPTDEEWKILEGAVDSLYRIGDPEWEKTGDFRGIDAGKNLKAQSGWLNGGNGTDEYGFSAFPGGGRGSGGGFSSLFYWGNWWSSSAEYGLGISRSRYIYYEWDVIGRGSGYYPDGGFNVRCLRDEIHIPAVKLTFTAVNNTSYVSLDSIKVMNRTTGLETMIYGNDTTLILPIELQFTPGDNLLYVGYADYLQSGIPDSPEENTTYIFQFATNIPCPGTPTVEYEGQVYNTIQIFSQCWMKENLNVGTMVDGMLEQEDNGIIEKYCYDNDTNNCTMYGGIYQWDELMNYTMQNNRGICPEGWHVATDEEWKILEGAVDSQYKIGDPLWDLSYFRGYDAAPKLKSVEGWYVNNGTDLYGFSCLPGGNRSLFGEFHTIGNNGSIWTSSGDNVNACSRDIFGHLNSINRSMFIHLDGNSARCVKDY